MRKVLFSFLFIFWTGSLFAQQQNELVVQIEGACQRNLQEITSKLENIPGATLTAYCLEKGIFLVTLSREQMYKHEVHDAVRKDLSLYKPEFKVGLTHAEIMKEFTCVMVAKD